jgi:hypothetical protein
MPEKKPKIVRMATTGKSATRNLSIPRGIEVLVKKAAVDPSFRDILLKKRAGAAESIGLRLDLTEVAMLATIPEAQLSAIIAGTKVAPGIRTAFLGYAAAVMLAALGCSTNSGSTTATTSDPGQIVPQGISPDTSYVMPKPADNIPKETGILKGKVTDQQGRVIKNTDITVTLVWVVIPGNSSSTTPDAPIRGMAYNPGQKAAPSRTVTAEAYSGKDGIFLFPALPAGIYAVSAVVSGYLNWTNSEVQVTAGGTTEMTIQMMTDSKLNLDGGARPDLPDSGPSTTGIRPDIPEGQ